MIGGQGGVQHATANNPGRTQNNDNNNRNRSGGGNQNRSHMSGDGAANRAASNRGHASMARPRPQQHEVRQRAPAQHQPSGGGRRR